ncbi:hypothetical protein EE612_022912 [Oryza sativa]|nr:hypothetical protein EE612_022912 [Oryza sativa]
MSPTTTLALPPSLLPLRPSRDLRGGVPSEGNSGRRHRRSFVAISTTTIDNVSPLPLSLLFPISFQSARVTDGRRRCGGRRR